MHPLTTQMVAERRRELGQLAGPGHARTARRRPVSRSVGLVLIRVGRRLAGPEELRRLPPGTRSVLRLYR